MDAGKKLPQYRMIIPTFKLSRLINVIAAEAFTSVLLLPSSRRHSAVVTALHVIRSGLHNREEIK
jgi:hypothetical protein